MSFSIPLSVKVLIDVLLLLCILLTVDVEVEDEEGEDDELVAELENDVEVEEDKLEVGTGGCARTVFSADSAFFCILTAAVEVESNEELEEDDMLAGAELETVVAVLAVISILF